LGSPASAGFLCLVDCSVAFCLCAQYSQLRTMHGFVHSFGAGTRGERAGGSWPLGGSLARRFGPARGKRFESEHAARGVRRCACEPRPERAAGRQRPAFGRCLLLLHRTRDALVLQDTRQRRRASDPARLHEQARRARCEARLVEQVERGEVDRTTDGWSRLRPLITHPKLCRDSRRGNGRSSSHHGPAERDDRR